jgi:hypothetical protein
MIKLSPGLASAMLTNYGFGIMMQYGVIDIYSSTQPNYAHFAPNGTHLARVTKDGLPFVFGGPENGLSFDYSQPSEIRDTGDWVITGLAEGAAGWWRFKWWPGDDDSEDPYYPRMDGEVGETLILAGTAITPSTSLVVTEFLLRFE